MNFRHVLWSLVTAGLATLAQAQPARFPERPITMVVPFGPGGTTDIMARILADEFSRQLGGSVVVVNTAGAGGPLAWPKWRGRAPTATRSR